MAAASKSQIFTRLNSHFHFNFFRTRLWRKYVFIKNMGSRIRKCGSITSSQTNTVKFILPLRFRKAGRVWSHERLTEPHVTMDWLFGKPRSFSNLPAFLDLNGSRIYFHIVLYNVEARELEEFFILRPHSRKSLHKIYNLAIGSYFGHWGWKFGNSKGLCSSWGSSWF